MSTKDLSKSIDAFNEAMASGSFHTAKQIGLLLIQDDEFKSDSLKYTKILQLLGNASFILSEFPQAISYYNQSIEISKSIQDSDGVAACLGNLGLVSHTLSGYTEALKYLEQAIALNEINGNKKYLAFNLGNVGLVFSSLLDKEKALEYYNRAMLINDEIQNIEGLASNHGNIGLLYQDDSRYDEALACFEKALFLYQKIDNKKAVATSFGNIGNTYFNKDEIDKALSYHEKAIAIYREIQNKDGLAHSYGAIGNILIKQNEYDEALKFTRQCHDIANEIGDQESIMNALFSISKIHELKNDYELALRNYQKYTELKDRIQSDETKKQAYLFDQRHRIEEEEKSRQLQYVRMEEQEKLLHSILPVNIAERILKQEQLIADYYPSVSVLFLDIVGFTNLSSNISPQLLVHILDTIFSKTDEIIELHGLEKIKTIGDGYLAVGNLTSSLEYHQEYTAKAALDIMDSLHNLEIVLPDSIDLKEIDYIPRIQVRIGIHSGEVVAGIVGKNKFIFDLWGDAVNIASRMESNSESGKIQVSEVFAASLSNSPAFSLKPRGSISIKGKGEMNTWWLENG